ncbi:MAG: ECF transporter S component [Lachnospiraceae bacterium]|jgi:uncharacterized membrane protein|nr:ECF transporter S component [Lachnospiraceae bacterium]
MMKLALTGVIAATAYVLFTFLRIPMPGGLTAVHLGNAVCVLGALLLGGVYGGLGASLGLVIADLTSPYFIFAPTTFVLKLLIGLITGFIAHRIGKINGENDPKKVFMWTSLAAAGGLMFNMVVAPLVNYYYQVLLLGRSTADITLSFNILASVINAVTSLVVSVSAYIALRPALKKIGFLE